MIKTLELSKIDFDKNNYYIGEIDISNFNGNIEIDKKLGTVCFKEDIQILGNLSVHFNTSIKVNGNIKAEHINVRGDIFAKNIFAKLVHSEKSIKVSGNIVSRTSIGCCGDLHAFNLSSQKDITAKNIFCKGGIVAGENITADEIETGDDYCIIAGANCDQKYPGEIVCKNLYGNIKYGTLVYIRR